MTHRPYGLVASWLVLTSLALSSCNSLVSDNQSTRQTSPPAYSGIGTKADPMARMQHDRDMLVDPASQAIPGDMRAKELDFFAQMSQANQPSVLSDWQSRGPWNVGGRTRGLVIDRSNEQILLAGSASGGVWKSINAGESWYKVSTNTENIAVTSLIQDPRPGRELEWYYTTGELFGASQSGVGAFFLGNGVYKSVDGGETWSGIASTQQNSPQSFNSIWEGIWGIAIDPSNTDSTEIYVATYGAIHRSVDGGDTWSIVINSNIGSTSSYFTEVLVTDSGVVYAALSYENEIISFGLGANGGVWRSETGEDFVDIRPADFPEEFGRTVMAVSPENPDKIFCLLANVDSLSAPAGEFFNGGVQYSGLWSYEYLAGDGTGDDGLWTDLSEQMPADTGVFDDFYPQSGYDLAIAVQPGNEELILLGGTNLYRSTSGYADSVNTRFIGGYAEHSSFPDFGIYLNHHPDQHHMTFSPSDPQVVYNANDGGVYRTDDISADTVAWTSLNRGYLTTQAYGLGIDMLAATERIVVGLQDNGNFFVNEADPQADWTLPLNGDGCYTYFARNDDYALLSIQNGRVFKCQLSESGELEAFDRIDPGLESSGHDFIHPYIMSPNDDATVYFPYQNRLYVHRGIDTVAMGADYEANLNGWELFTDSLPVEGMRITSISAAEDGSNRLYLGTDNEDIYRIDDATDLDAPFIDVTQASLPGAHIDCIAIDPLDSDKAMAVYTNYGVYSLWYTENAGADWERAGGNLEANSAGTGNGPSCRWATIHRWHPDSVVYVVGTSVGLFSTSVLDGTDTEWQHESPEGIGNVVVSYVTSRAVDKRVFVGSHGAGVYQATVDNLSLPSSLSEIDQDELRLGIYPNPSADYITVSAPANWTGVTTYTLIDARGKVISTSTSRQGAGINYELSALPMGTYYIHASHGQERAISSFVRASSGQ